MSQLSLPEAQLISLVIAAVLYGIYLVTLGVCLRLLLTSESGALRRRSEIRWVITLVSGMLFVNGTLDFVIQVIQVMEAFVTYTGVGGAEHVFTHSSGYQTMIKSFCVPFQSLLGDAVLIYRCWFLWDRSWLIIFVPSLIWLANIACAIRFLDLLAKATQGLIISTAVKPWVQAFWALTITINVTTTTLIVLRIWLVDRQNRKLGIRDHMPRSALSYAMRNIIESGMIYTIVSIFTLVTTVIQSNLTYPASAMEIHSVGIMFNLIILRSHRVASRLRHETTTTGSVPLRIQQRTVTNTVAGDGVEDELYTLSRLDKETQFTTTRLGQSDKPEAVAL
ncbi:carboxylic ester hydrolase [Favolaschia claudopus]|uniref:Carboxylic ester hydrolase n=1 Tax=Favolaschia claudopus TaxID=2862362 RepID=A0AAW0D143_9AGAR